MNHPVFLYTNTHAHTHINYAHGHDTLYQNNIIIGFTHNQYKSHEKVLIIYNVLHLLFSLSADHNPTKYYLHKLIMGGTLQFEKHQSSPNP